MRMSQEPPLTYDIYEPKIPISPIYIKSTFALVNLNQFNVVLFLFTLLYQKKNSESNQ